MRNKDFSTLSYLARAIAVRPDQAAEFVDALRGDVHGVTLDLPDSPDLERALDAIVAAWRRQRQRNPDDTLTLRDVLAAAEDLERAEDSAAQLAGSTLRSAVRELLLRKGRELGLTNDERALAESELPSLVD